MKAFAINYARMLLFSVMETIILIQQLIRNQLTLLSKEDNKEKNNINRLCSCELFYALV